MGDHRLRLGGTDPPLAEGPTPGPAKDRVTAPGHQPPSMSDGRRTYGLALAWPGGTARVCMSFRGLFWKAIASRRIEITNMPVTTRVAGIADGGV